MRRCCDTLVFGGLMTIIAYKDGIMAADSCSFSGGRRYPVTRPKIVKGSLGLFGCAGRDSDGYLAKDWFLAGMSKEHPKFSEDKDDELHVMWAKADGTVWWADYRLAFVPMPAPAAIGESAVLNFVEGLMCGGFGVAEAVSLAIQHCIWIGGAVQIERLENYPCSR